MFTSSASDTNVILEEKVGTPNLAFTQELVPGLPFFEYIWRPATEEELSKLSMANNDRSDLLPPRTFELETLPPIDEDDSIETPIDELHEVFRHDRP